ncbi:MAG: amidohydrolase family protein [Solirubrobacteraceae bacterium]|nr:amidohydrolase family protein [Solirubrobacteraceae bacterium]
MTSSSASGNLLITGARVLGADGPVDVAIVDGRIASIEPADGGDQLPGALDARGGMLLPGFVECHFHPDKALTRERLGPVDSTSMRESMERGVRIKEGFTRDDIVQRATRALAVGVSHGVTTVVAQIDVDTSIGLMGIEAMLEVRRAFAGALDLQLVAFPQQGVVSDPGAEDLLREALRLGADALGGGPTNEQSPDDYDEHLRRLFAIAAEFDCLVDVHVDMEEDPQQQTLASVARATIAAGWHGRVRASHCCALASYPQALADETIALVREAGIQVCLCPMGNLLLGDTAHEPRGRGASRPKALLAAGVNVALGTDNVNDMWFRFGRLDPAELAMISSLAMGMRTDREVLDAVDMVTTRAAAYAGLTDYGVEPGAVADLVLFEATTIEDVLRGAPGSRKTIKGGRVVAGVDHHTWQGWPVAAGQRVAPVL